jgi:putative SOS response-associated peptidase YedK
MVGTRRRVNRNGLTRRRCLVLANAFYEWRKDGKLRTPFYYTLKGGEPFAFAGLWSVWKNPSNGEVINSCAIVTTAPNDLTAQVHDRMPVILPEETEGFWLNPAIVDPSVLTAALRPFPAGSMNAREVSRAVNSVKNDGPDLIVGV